MTCPMLLLNSWMAPHEIVPWQDALIMLFTGKIDVLAEYEDVDICSPSISIKMPAVARLRKEIGGFKKGVKFSRLNVFARDDFRCQYCGIRKTARELNYDHVIPRRLGGRTTWENIVSSCYRCNDRKGGRTPEQAGMKLSRKPFRPKALPMSSPALPHVIPEVWEFYCPQFKKAM